MRLPLADPVIEPGALHAAMTGLLVAVKAELAKTTAGVPARVCLVPGGQPAWDDCECGMLAVHFVQMYPSKSFPQPDQTNRCDAPLWAVELAVTMLRCVPETEDASPPPCPALEAAAVTELADIEAVQRGALCAFSTAGHVVLGPHAAVGTEGVCAGSELRVIVGLGNCATECG